MLRTALAMSFVLLVACGKDVEDPGFTASASGTMTTAGTSTSDGEDTSGSASMTTTDASASASASTTTSADATTDDPSAGTTGPTSDTDSGGGCGDGAISPGEQCDGADLQGFTCMSLGLNGGTLACDPVMCTFDTSMCMSTSGGTSG